MLQRHLQDTYEYLFDTAHRALLDGASFAPFGAGIRKTGEQIHTNVDLPIERSAPTDHISGLIAGFRKDEEENGLIAAGLVFDGRARSDDAAALCFHIEAANGSAVEVIVPYTRQADSQIAFAEPQISAVESEIFTEVQ
ncbi:MAG TPA: hypothetical protein VEA80_00105 [Vitreimonas sp.]|uniref:hypothetical protein n=1 Tax=Vitreimonas sp. TaxID=3069702 RepID=UPI002D516D69|nr:hypothetical protein [Vitreimonas sp.]HYD85855.1 hypothetical protein [Vitreimonas sp.]